ncbi:MAG: Asp-tRNA(Asn)/Glu-tRNA(Gln) amidotransferase subunit GatB [Candidatus Methylacidiphilales bacterium]|nr:Asp-tRNA(Asn)/Glu-tRNA(Gln) amidotransferase subunit GatB [Candidatus Methylacidiphilales bacterium]
MEYEAVIGLEVHVQLRTNTKMFCGCVNKYGGLPNTHVCPICLGMPGVMPTPNHDAVVKTILTGLMLECNIATRCKFDRKNYFYPDMPKNYQISQYDEPLCQGGAVTLNLLAYPKDAQKLETTVVDKKIGLTRIHLEEDVAKSQHSEGQSGIDFNRAGTPLMEIVSEADMRTPEEAFAYLTALKQILIYGNVSDADMEKGQMRCDVNVSVRPRGQKEFGTKCEVKNLNSISAVRRSLKYEIERQIQDIEEGKKIVQCTLRWDDVAGKTNVMRLKEQAHDYRYFPEPDLLPLNTSLGLKTEAEALMPELPSAKKARLAKDFGISDYQASVLSSEVALADYFEKAAGPAKDKALVANFLLNDYLAIGSDLTAITLPANWFGELANELTEGKINSRQAKEVFGIMVNENLAPAEIIKARGFVQVSDTAQLEAWCDAAISNPSSAKSVADYKSGKVSALNALKGQVMKLSKGQANPQTVGDILEKKLKAL